MARGGAETLVAHLALALKRRDWDVHVVSLIPPTAFESELAAANIPLHAPGLWKIPSLLRQLRPQIVHCHMFHANLLGRLMRIIMPFPVVISTLHSVAESPRGSGRIVARDLIYRVSDSLADATVAVSVAVADRHREARAVPAPLVIPNGIDVTRFRPDAKARTRIREELAAGEEFVWLAVGRLMWKKNYPALLQAFETLGQGTLWIAGTGPDEEKLRAAAGHRVRFLGQREDIPDLMNAADAFVMSSLVEGLPLVLLEAAACGLPCVASDVGGIRETGIGSVVEVSRLGEAMLKMAAMPADHRRRLGLACRRIVEDRYSLDVVVSQWEALYRTFYRST